MLHSAKGLHGYTPVAVDGEIGSVEDGYFDDARWTIRYLVVDTGGWLSGRRVLISPYAIGALDPRERRLALTLPRELIRDSPDIDTAKPISRQHEAAYYHYYGWAPYWGGAATWGAYTYPYAMTVAPPRSLAGEAGASPTDDDGDPHLRSIAEVAGYDIAALDGDIGRVDDFLIDDQDWAIRYLAVDTGSWSRAGRQVLIAPPWIGAIDWVARKVAVELPKEAIAASPGIEALTGLDRDYERRLHDHYRRPAYWQ